MKKIRLTETELVNIVKRVINEDQAESVVGTTKFSDYIKENKEGLKGEFEISSNGNFYIITEGRITRKIIP
jgi:hypothetical protein